MTSELVAIGESVGALPHPCLLLSQAVGQPARIVLLRGDGARVIVEQGGRVQCKRNLPRHVATYQLPAFNLKRGRRGSPASYVRAA